MHKLATFACGEESNTQNSKLGLVKDLPTTSRYVMQKLDAYHVKCSQNTVAKIQLSKVAVMNIENPPKHWKSH